MLIEVPQSTHMVDAKLQELLRLLEADEKMATV